MTAFDRINDPVKLRRLVHAILALEGEVVLNVVLRRLVEEACALVEARYGALGVLNRDGTSLDQFITVGLEPDEVLAIGARPVGLGVLGVLIADPIPLRLPDLTADPHSCGFPPRHPGMSSFLGVPVRIRDQVFGHLYLTNKDGATEFSEDDEASATVLASAAGVAIEKARLQTAVRDHTLTEDRDRIARDLHDSIIQRLFAVALSLQGTLRLVDRPEAVGRIGDAINKVDETIRLLRSAIFDLEVSLSQDGFRRQTFDLLHELGPVLGTHPQVTFSGPVDTAVSGPRAEHALAALREALTNVAKHAGASNVVVTIAAGDDLRLIVADDGRGMGETNSSGLGLKNMRQRAVRLGGSLDLSRSREGGTRVTWVIPLGGEMVADREPSAEL